MIRTSFPVYNLFASGLVVQSVPGGRWDDATQAQEDDALDILNGYKRPHPNVAHFRHLETMPQPTGKGPSILVPLAGVALLSLCILSAGASWAAAFAALSFGLYGVGKAYGSVA